MKTIRRIGIYAFALAALAVVFPHAAVAETGSIRSINAYDPETGHREYGPNDLIRIGETFAFKVRLLNYNTNLTASGGYDNYWNFRLQPNADAVWATNNLPQLGLWISGHKRFATLKSVVPVEHYYTDLIFEYTAQAGDMALPVKFCNASGTSELLNSDDQVYLLQNVGPFSYWELKDNYGHECQFYFGPSGLSPSSTEYYAYPPPAWSAAYETRDYDLSQARIYVQTVDFDQVSTPVWRTVYENKTTTADGNGLPALVIPGGATAASTVYLWTEDSDIAVLNNGSETTYHSLDHEGNPKDYVVYKANIVNQETFPFRIKGGSGKAGQSTTIYLSTTPTNTYNSAGTLVTNFVWRTVAVTNQANPEVLIEILEPSVETAKTSIDCTPAFDTAQARLRITVDAFTNAVTVSLNPTLGVSGPALPSGLLGIAESADGALLTTTEVTFPARSSMDDEPQVKTFYLFGLGFATNETFKTTSRVVVFSPTITGDNGVFAAIDPATLTVKETKPTLSGVPDDITPTAKEDYPMTLKVADSYANLHGADSTGYAVWWKRNTSVDWALLQAGVAANADGEITFNLNYPSSGDFQTSIRVVGPDGLTSDAVAFGATVASRRRALVMTDHDGDAELPRQYNENDAGGTVKIKISLENWKNETGADLYAFLEPLDGTENYISAARFLTTTANSRSVIKIPDGATESSASVANSSFYVLDGDKDHGDLNFKVHLRTKPDWNDADAETIFTDDVEVIEALNVPPAFMSVTMSGGSALTRGDGTETQTADQGLQKTFKWVVDDVAADMDTMKTKWTITDPYGSIAKTETLAGNPDTLNFQYKFLQTGVYTVLVQLQDKDMGTKEWTDFTFKVNVGDAPRTVFEFPDGSDDRFHFQENAIMVGYDDYFRVGLSTAATDPIGIRITRTRIGADGTLDLSGAASSDSVYVTIPAGQTIGNAGLINFDALDGTKASKNNSGGFELTATVTNTNLSADNIPYNQVYAPTKVRVYVDNIDPQVEVDPAAIGTNGYYEAEISANEQVQISWEVEDVPADLATGLELKWSGLPANYQYESGSASSASGTISFSFTSSGNHPVTLVVKDKDGGQSRQFRWVYMIRASKDLHLYPLGPVKHGQSDLSDSYASAPGIGKGRVYAEGGECTGVLLFRQAWSFTTTSVKVPLWAWGYNVGDVDNGTLPGYDIRIDPNGNNPKPSSSTITSFYRYPDTTYDSFFYAWVNNVSDGESGGTVTGTAYPSPAKGTNDVVVREFSLPTEEQGDEKNPYYDQLIVEAVFSKELRPADNLGDINQDGIPDVYAVSTRFDGGKLYELAGAAGGGGGGGGGGENAGAITTGGADLKDVSTFNDDEDYLPSRTSAGGTLIPNVVANWATTGRKFTADYELRGFGIGLNYREDSDGLNRNVRGTWISEPEFSPAETNAYLRFCAKSLGTTDPAVVALAEAACSAAGEDPSDPDALAPYLETALAEYAKSDEFKAAVFKPEYMATVNWSPENRTDPTMEDTDGDELPDGYEYYFWYYSFIGYEDGTRMVGSRFNPDNVAQGIELSSDDIADAFNPTVKSSVAFEERDTDADGLTDLEELAMGTNPIDWDTDQDGMSDLYEVMWGLNPLKNENADRNPDGDYMASWTSDATWAIVTVPNVGVYAVNESEGVLDGFVAGEKETEGTLDVSEQPSFEGVPVFWYGKDGTTPMPKSRVMPLLAQEVDVSGVTETITVLRNKAIRLIHDQVYNQFGFDPRTGWNRTKFGYVDNRWDPVNNGRTTADKFTDGATGYAINTEAFTSLDEYLLCKYRKETGAPKGKDLEESWQSLHPNALRTVANILWAGCTCPNMPFEDKTVGDGEETFGSAVYGADTDGDGVPDGWELYVSHNPNDGNEGPVLEDDDRLTYTMEFAGTDSCNAYTNTPSIYANHPGNTSGWYNKFFPTDPFNADTDGDGITDSDEGKTWTGSFYAGRRVSAADEAADTTFTFIYGPNEGKPEGDDGSRCIRGGGLNPCTVDTDMDLLPDPWERQFAGVVFNADGKPDKMSLPDDVVRLFRVSDGLDDMAGNEMAKPLGFYITGGMDGTYGPCADPVGKQPGDAFTAFNSNVGAVDPRTGTRRDCDWDHDGLENFQEYLVQTLRHLRYDDSETPLMGMQLSNGVQRLTYNKCIPFQAFDGAAFYEACRAAGFKATSAWKYRELGYFARPPHEWDRVAQDEVGNAVCANYAGQEGTGYRILLPPKGLAAGASMSSEIRLQADGYVCTDPRRWDSDDDGLDDYWELFHGLNPILGSAEQMGVNDVIADRYMVSAAMAGSILNAWCNAWTGWPLMSPAQPEFDAIKYPWMMGTPECDADGDGIRNAEEGLFVNITSPSPKHTDPTPLWMTDSTSPNGASYTAQYYRLDPYVDPDNMGKADVYNYPWGWKTGDALGASEGQAANWMFAFEENEGYDTDSDRQPDNSESTKKVENASDPLVFSDPDRRQALYLPGWHTSELTGVDIGSAVVSRGGSDTMQKPISSSFDMLRQFTVEAWVRPEKFDAEQVILERVANYGTSSLSNSATVIRANFRIGLTADNRFYAEYDGNTADSGTARLVGPAATTNWTHLAFTYDGSTVALYINDEDVPVAKAENISLIPANGIVVIQQEAGNMSASAVTIGNKTYSAAPCAFIIGARAVTDKAIELSKDTDWSAFGDYFTGWVDEVRVWDGARTGAELAADCRKRYSFEDVKNMRQNVYQSWVTGAVRNDVYGKVLPVELLQHYSFCTLPGALDAGGVAIEPVDFTKNVLDNVRIDGSDETILGAGGLNVGWWWELPVHSDVYYDYHTVPWIQNTCAHLPFMDGSTPDSMYWSEGFGGFSPASMDGVTSYSFPNSANPYPFYTYLHDRATHHVRLERFAEGANSAYSSYQMLYEFQLRAGFVGTSDLVPLGGAFAKRADMLWDGGSADAWKQTGGDSDGDGLPDWWEAFVAAGGNASVEYTDKDGNAIDPANVDWSAQVRRNGVQMTFAQAYLRDLADGMVYRYDADTGAYSVAIDVAYAAKVDENSNSILDWWEKLYDVYGESSAGDHDNDQLSNFAEYLIGECFTRVNGTNRKSGYDANDIFKTLDPTAMRTYRSEGQLVPDYFRRVGSLYLGEMFTDHDFMEDWWELYVNDPSYASRFSYDPRKDADGDGWTTFAECRHSLWKALTTSDLIDRWLIDNLEAYEACHPEPAIGVKVSYHGNQDVAGAPLVARVSTGRNTVRDATFTVPSPNSGSTKSSSYIGPYRKDAVIHGHLNPGSISASSVTFLRVPLASDKKYHWSYEKYASSWGAGGTTTLETENGTVNISNWALSYGGAEAWHGIGSFEEYLSEYAKYPLIELEEVSLVWKQLATTKPIGADSHYGQIIYSSSSTSNGTTTVTSGEIGRIDYRTGEYELDMARLAAAEGTTSELEASVFMVEYSYRMGMGWPQTVYLSQPDSGHVREGVNYVSLFFDLDGNGKWTAGEPYGVAKVDVGWWKTTTEIELTDTNPSMARFDLTSLFGSSSGSSGSSSGGSSSSGSSESSAGGTDRDVNGSIDDNVVVENTVSNMPPAAAVRLRVVRTAVNGQRVVGSPAFNEVVLERTINANLQTCFTEADLVADGQNDLDWDGIWPVWRDVIGNGSASFADIESATYRVVVGNGDISSNPDDGEAHLSTEFVNSFETLANQSRTTPLSPQGRIDSARPTFKWRHDNTIGKSYPAFRLRVWKADGTTLVYDSGVQRAPARTETGVYTWTAPLYADMVTARGLVFATTNNYKWAVSMLDAKFTSFNSSETKMDFRLECSGAGGVSDYGSLALQVKYFGPGSVSKAATSSREKLIRVQAFDTPDFSGTPAGEAYVKDISNLASISNISVNARIIGLKPGTYYVRAFIDTNGNGTRQVWESWGYANYVGTGASAVYNPKPLEIVAGSTEVPVAAIYIEDADSDDDGFPDIYEYDKNGDLTTLGPASGATFFTQVNPDLKAALSAYAKLNLEIGSSASSAPLLRMMSAGASSAEGLNAFNELLSGTPEVEVDESSVTVTIESFSMDDGITVRVEPVVSAGTSGLLSVSTDPVAFRLELRHKATLAEADWATVASVPLSVKANETVTLSGDDLAPLRAKISELKSAGSAGFFKVVLTQ